LLVSEHTTTNKSANFPCGNRQQFGGGRRRDEQWFNGRDCNCGLLGHGTLIPYKE
jgi:hypothetical protein